MQINVGDKLRLKGHKTTCKVIDVFYDERWKYIINVNGTKTRPLYKEHVEKLFNKVTSKHIETIQENYCI